MNNAWERQPIHTRFAMLDRKDVLNKLDVKLIKTRDPSNF